MCTLTLISTNSVDTVSASGAAEFAPMPGLPTLRLMMNRDELRTRPRALAPAIHSFAPRSILMPLDPTSQGTWIGINDRGIYAALLNLTEPDHLASSENPGRSRGTIIPTILQNSTLTQARTAAQTFLLDGYTPFRLLIGSLDGAYLLHSRAGSIDSLMLPALLTSSGLGDHLVHPPRVDLFARTLARDLSPQSQDAFHHSVFPQQHHLSVLMDRADARTVSITTLELSPRSATMHYQDLLTQQRSSAHLALSQLAESPTEFPVR